MSTERPVLPAPIQTPEELVREFDRRSDADLSLADIQWLTRNIRERDEARDAAAAVLRAERGA